VAAFGADVDEVVGFGEDVGVIPDDDDGVADCAAPIGLQFVDIKNAQFLDGIIHPVGDDVVAEAEVFQDSSCMIASLVVAKLEGIVR